MQLNIKTKKKSNDTNNFPHFWCSEVLQEHWNKCVSSKHSLWHPHSYYLLLLVISSTGTWFNNVLYFKYDKSTTFNRIYCSRFAFQLDLNIRIQCKSIGSDGMKKKDFFFTWVTVFFQPRCQCKFITLHAQWRTKRKKNVFFFSSFTSAFRMTNPEDRCLIIHTNYLNITVDANKYWLFLSL